jgi:hypothetical protein
LAFDKSIYSQHYATTPKQVAPMPRININLKSCLEIIAGWKQKLLLQKYEIATFRHFSRQILDPCVAFDVGRVGGFARLIAFVVGSDNTAAWCKLLVPRQHA